MHIIPAVLATALRRTPPGVGSTRGTPWLAVCLVALLVVVVSGCTGSAGAQVGSVPGDVCEQAFARADAQPSQSVSGTDLDAAVRSCTLDQWGRASKLYPGVLGGVAPLTFLATRCADVAAGLSRYAACMGLVVALATPAPTPSPTPRPTKKPRVKSRATAKPSPRVTPRPTSSPSNGVPSVTGADFGPGVQVSWYSIMGDSPAALTESILARGPELAWLGERAEALTTPSVSYRFVALPDGSGSCRPTAFADPAIETTFTIDLPRWAPPRTADPAAVRWWATELMTVVRHERTHVRLMLAATRKANKVLKSSTCANWSKKLAAVWREARRQNCSFDMDEYGRESGLSMQACMRG